MAVMSCRDGSMALWATMLMMVKFLTPKTQQLERKLRVGKSWFYTFYALYFSEIISFQMNVYSWRISIYFMQWYLTLFLENCSLPNFSGVHIFDITLVMRNYSYIIWLAPRAGKMHRMLRYYWLPERARWSSRLPVLSRKKNFPESHRINPSLTKPVRSRWQDIDFFASLGNSTPSRSINTQKKQLGQCPAMLNSHLVNNPYLQKVTVGYFTQFGSTF